MYGPKFTFDCFSKSDMESTCSITKIEGKGNYICDRSTLEQTKKALYQNKLKTEKKKDTFSNFTTNAMLNHL